MNVELKHIETTNCIALKTHDWYIEYKVKPLIDVCQYVHVIRIVNGDEETERNMQKLQQELQHEEEVRTEIKLQEERKVQYNLLHQRSNVVRVESNMTPLLNIKGLINRIDYGLEQYYRECNRKHYKFQGSGKFIAFTERYGLSDDDVYGALINDGVFTYSWKEKHNLVEFDPSFPLCSQIIDDATRNKEIIRILFLIGLHGKYVPKKMEISLKIVDDITSSQMDNSALRYSTQMSYSLAKHVNKNTDLRHFLAVGEKLGYPFLTYIMDCYTKDKVKHYHREKKQLSISEWVKQNNFMIALKNRGYDEKAEQLQGAMRSYGARIMKRINFIPPVLINDSLKEISKYITATSIFIHKLMAEIGGSAPFQLDLMIAVTGMAINLPEKNHELLDDTDDSDDDSDDEKLNPMDDHIGVITDEFGSSYRHENWSLRLLQRRLTSKYYAFRTGLATYAAISKTSKYNAKTYPQNRRFSIFVDRRDIDDDDNMNDVDDMDDVDYVSDRIVYLDPPDNCNSFPHGHVPEIGFELIKKCLLKSGTSKERKNITSEDSLCGQLLTFMFVVDGIDDIKCYMVWNGETMRFHGEYMTQLLPDLFVKNRDNVDFQNSTEGNQLAMKFDQLTGDQRFERFYEGISNYK
eukprot:446674_1